MITLLRKIRQRLVASGSITKYLLYATGEILLVVIGILLALQINTWNQQQLDNNREQNYLKQIKQELENNVSFIQWFYLDRYDRKVEALDIVRDYYQGTFQIEDSARFAVEAGYGAVFGTQTFQTSTAVFDEIVNTGNLGTIRDEDLRRRLINYYGTIETRLEALKDYDSGYLLMLNSLRPFNSDNPDSISTFDMELTIKSAGTEELYKAATAELTYAYQAINFMSIIKEDAEEIIRIINENNLVD